MNRSVTHKDGITNSTVATEGRTYGFRADYGRYLYECLVRCAALLSTLDREEADLADDGQAGDDVGGVADHGQGDEAAGDDQWQREEDHQGHQQQVDQADGHQHGIGHVDEAVGQLRADAGLADLHVVAGLAPGERRDGHLALACDDDRAVARAHRCRGRGACAASCTTRAMRWRPPRRSPPPGARD